MLLGIWWGSVMLCVVGLGALAVLIGLRAYRRRRDIHDLALFRTLSRDLVIWLDDATHDISALRSTAAVRPAFIGPLLFRTADLVQGDERAHLVGLAHELGLEERLSRSLRRGHTAQRRQAAETLAMFESDEAIAALRAALNDRHAAVRLAAARSLAQQGQRVPLAPLTLDPVRLGDSILVQDLFGKLAIHQSDELATLAADEATEPRVRATAVQALAGAGRYECLPLFLSMASSGQDLLREAAAAALGVLGHPRGARVLLSLFHDPCWPVRAAAAEAAGRIASPDLAPGLEHALSDENWWVRSRAADALSIMGEAGRVVLSRVARGPVSPARDAAALNLSAKVQPQ